MTTGNRSISPFQRCSAARAPRPYAAIDLFEADRRVNETEQRVRRQRIVHSSAGSAISAPETLVYMSASCRTMRRTFPIRLKIGQIREAAFSRSQAVEQAPGNSLQNSPASATFAPFESDC